MSSDEILADLALDAAFHAAHANGAFLASVVAALVRSGAMSLNDVADALESERAVIEDNRSAGLDPRLAAIAFGRLAERLRDTLPGLLDAPGHLAGWSLDPNDPTWPFPPDNDR